MDIEYRKKWDAYVSKIEMLESNNNADIIYWDVKYGIPMVSNRDYIYCREFKGQTHNFRLFLNINLNPEVCENDEDYIVILSKTYENGKELVPVHKSKVRVDGFKQFMVLKKTASGTMLYMHRYLPRQNVRVLAVSFAIEKSTYLVSTGLAEKFLPL